MGMGNHLAFQLAHNIPNTMGLKRSAPLESRSGSTRVYGMGNQPHGSAWNWGPTSRKRVEPESGFMEVPVKSLEVYGCVWCTSRANFTHSLSLTTVFLSSRPARGGYCVGVCDRNGNSGIHTIASFRDGHQPQRFCEMAAELWLHYLDSTWELVK